MAALAQMWIKTLKHCLSFSDLIFFMNFRSLCNFFPRGCRRFYPVLQITNSRERALNKIDIPKIKSFTCLSSKWVMMTWDTNDKHEARMAAKRNRATDENDERPKRVKLSLDTETQRSDDSNKFLIICFDLELTDGSYASEIFQVLKLSTSDAFLMYWQSLI